MNMMSKTNQQHWQHYIAERDELFLRSRTVSVREMTTTLAHELNQPLGAVSNILNGLQLRLKDGQIDTDQYSEAVELALQQTQFAARVISRIRDFTDSSAPAFVQYNVVDLLNHSVRLLDWVFSGDGIRIVLVSAEPDSQECKKVSLSNDNEHALVDDPALFLATGDYTMIQQVFTNLLRNAADALREIETGPRTIRVTVARVDEGIQVDISDNGPGLQGVQPESLFTPFQTAKEGGMGVGLNICQSFVELHQGKLWITENQAGGCTAHVLLRTQIPGERNE